MTDYAREIKKTTSRKGFVSTLVALFALTFFSPDVDAGPHELNRTRSIYVPVRFETCEHLSHVTLTVTGDPTVFAPRKRIFLFTYYPERDAVLPDFSEVWIEGEATTEEGTHAIRTNLFVTPERIVSSRDHLERGDDEITKQLRGRRDVRLPATVIHIKCEDSCERWSKAATGSTGMAADEADPSRGPRPVAPARDTNGKRGVERGSA